MSTEPLDLASPRWRELKQAYGSAEDISSLLAALNAIDDDDERAELWYGAWATLCPGNNVFSAAYAAVPHLLRVVEERDFAERVAALHLVTQVEVSRHVHGAPAIDDDLVLPYAAAIESLPRRVAELGDMTWDSQSAQVLAAALLAGKRQHALARLMLDHASDAA
ncbi:MAG: hypothetical protein M3Z05_21375 [Gemmatimonadota bacterium]|nr:hypothetical protein [Gemmatimonadota bacterium]